MRTLVPLILALLIGVAGVAQSASAQISVRVYTGDNPHIVARGCNVHVVTDQEIDKYHLRSSGRIQDHIEKGWGKRPKEIYFKDSGRMPWKASDASYARFGWHPVQVKLCVAHARILEVTSQPFLIAEQIYENHNDQPATYTAEVSRDITHSVSRSWNAQVTAGFEQTISYEVGGDAVGGKVGGSTTISFEASYGQGGENTQSETVGTQTGIEVPLKPGTGAKAQLVASKGVIHAQIDYELTIDGQVFLDFGPKKYKGHHFYGTGLSQAWGKHISERTSERLSIEHFSHVHTIVEKYNP